MTAASEPRTFRVDEEDDGIRLDRWFKRHIPDVSFNQVSRWARTGQIRLDGKRAIPGARIQAGQEIRVPPADATPVGSMKPKKVQADPLADDEIAFVKSLVITEGKDWIALNKPPGLATQGGTKMKNHLDRLLAGLDEGLGKPKLVHRLDKDTSGVLLVAKTARAAGHFAKAFAGRSATKLYWALVIGRPEIEDAMIDLPLAKQPGTGGEKMHVDHDSGQKAKSRMRIIDRAANRTTWVELRPLTGRTHQLRAHMAAIGHPIVGDAKYGGQEAFLTGGISRKMHLHARRLLIEAPDGVRIDVSAPLPEHFDNSLGSLGFDIATGDALPLHTPDPAKTPEAKAKRAAAAAKSKRRARKGERRNRGQQGKPPQGKGRPPRGKPKGGKPTRGRRR